MGWRDYAGARFRRKVKRAEASPVSSREAPLRASYRRTRKGFRCLRCGHFTQSYEGIRSHLHRTHEIPAGPRGGAYR